MKFLLKEREHYELKENLEKEVDEMDTTIRKLESQIKFHSERQKQFTEELSELHKIRDEYLKFL